MNKKKRLQEVRSRLAELNAIEERSAEETTELDALLAEGEQLETEIQADTEREERSRRLIESASRSANPLPMGGDPTPPNGDVVVRGGLDLSRVRVPAVARAAKGKVFSDDRLAYVFARMALGGYNHAPSLRWLKEQGISLRASGQQESDDMRGGYLVAPEVSTEIIRLVAQYGVIRSRARITPMGSSSMNVPKRVQGFSAVPSAELGTATVQEAKWGQIELTARKWVVLARTSSEITEDTFVDLGNELATEIALAFAIAEDNAGFLGDGTSTYHRITGVVPSLTGVASNAGVVAAAGNGLDEITSTNLITVKSKLPSYARQLDPNGIAWYCSQEFESAVFERIALAAGGATAERWLSGAERSFLGFPVVITESLIAQQVNSGVPLVFGSLNLGVRFGDRRQLTLDMSEHIAFREDAVEWRATERFDINVHEPGTSSAAGPLVGLQLAAS